MKRIFNLRKKTLLFHLCTYCLVFLFVLSFMRMNISSDDADCFLNLHNFNLAENNISTKADLYFTKFLNKHYSTKQFIKTDLWLPISNNGYIYSAYFDYCPSFLQHSAKFCIKCIGFAEAKTVKNKPLHCSFKAGSDIIGSGIIQVEIVPESHSMPYTAVNFYCVMKNFRHNMLQPEYVAIISSSNNISWLSVKNLLPSRAFKDKVISLCLRPLYGMISFSRFVEFLTYYSVMGVDHFIMYHHNTSKPVELFFKFLMSTNISIDLLSWDIPISNDLIHEFGQLIFTQDCITRSKYRFSHTIVVDFDELIVPQFHPNIKTLLQYLDETNPKAGAYIIPMSLFCEEYSLEKYPFGPFHILNHNKRQKSVWQYGFRSKFVVRPERILLAGIHFVWQYDGVWHDVHVSDSLALLNHYRNCCGMQQTFFFHLFTFHVMEDTIISDNKVIQHELAILNHTLMKTYLEPY